MHAKLFFQTGCERSIQLVLVKLNQWMNKEIDLDTYESNQLVCQQFQGQFAELGLIYNKQGSLVKVFIGMGAVSESKAMAYAATKLPKGSYLPPKSLSFVAKINWALAQYSFNRYKLKKCDPRQLIVDEQLIPALVAQVDAVYWVRDLINTPANDLGPKQLAEATAELSSRYHAEFKQWIGDELLAANFPAIHAVGRASASLPRLLLLNWGEETHPLVSLVGKGVCFDSGGLDIKPCSNMRLMKKDMGGAAQVLGLAQWIMSSQLPVRLQVIIPAVENAIGPDAFRPGDVLTMRNGLTVEIDNTDAEGRLILADALTLACEQEPELLIDFSTLTGAARIAVGTDIAAMFSTDDKIAQELFEEGVLVEDFIWRLPLYQDYEEMLNSYIADLRNCSDTSYAGAITAALFLKRFVKPSIPWVHFDIMAWNLASKPGKPEGGEAMAIRALMKYLSLKFPK